MFATAFRCGVLLLALIGLPGCQPNQVRQATKPVQKKEYTLGPSAMLGPTTPLESASMELLSHLGWVQDAERGGMLPDYGPQDSISVYIAKKKYRFANLHQFRRNIRQCWDSLQTAGADLDVDTTAQAIQGKRRPQ